MGWDSIGPGEYSTMGKINAIGLRVYWLASGETELFSAEWKKELQYFHAVE
jgi:hypothetical protein